MSYYYDPEYPSGSGFWYCNVCRAQNSRMDGECQYCECEGPDCKRDNCSAPEHFPEEPAEID